MCAGTDKGMLWVQGCSACLCLVAAHAGSLGSSCPETSSCVDVGHLAGHHLLGGALADVSCALQCSPEVRPPPTPLLHTPQTDTLCTRLHDKTLANTPSLTHIGLYATQPHLSQLVPGAHVVDTLMQHLRGWPQPTLGI